MATRFNSGGGRPLPLALIADAAPRLSRDALEGLVQMLIDRLDELDAPTEDMEPDDDDACSAGEDFGGKPCPLPYWQHGATGIHEDDEPSLQPVTLN